MGIDTSTGGDDYLKSILEGLTDEQRDRLLEILQKDKMLREDKKEGKSEIINSVLKYFDEIFNGIEIMKQTIDGCHTNFSNFWSNVFGKIRQDFNLTVNKIKSDSNEWSSNKNITSSDIRAGIQDVLIHNSFKLDAWLNWLMKILSYSRSPFTNNLEMERHGIDISLLESICSNITKMLKEVNMEVVVPTVLVDKFDMDLYDYGNKNTLRIDHIFSGLDPKNYVHRVYEINNIGYVMKDKEGNIIESKKPDVFYY